MSLSGKGAAREANGANGGSGSTSVGRSSNGAFGSGSTFAIVDLVCGC